MYRIATNKLIKWKNSQRRKPLIVRGARQIGKTWTVEQFGRENYDDIHKIDFEKRQDLHSIFDGNLDPKLLISQLETLLNRKIKVVNYNIQIFLLYFAAN